MFRVGLGYDLHRLEAGRPLILGGVTVPFDKGLVGHSDADGVAHAIADALLGAAALGDIGQRFPDTDPRFKDANSLQLLRTVWGLVRELGFSLANVDCTIVAEAPKMAPHIPAMRSRIADCLDVEAGRVSIKAKTNEGVGPEGRGEAISTQAIVLIERR